MLGILIYLILVKFYLKCFSNLTFNDVSKVGELFNWRYVHPNAQYWFGTDSNGKSLFDSVWFGARNLSLLLHYLYPSTNVVIGFACRSAVWEFSTRPSDMIAPVSTRISNVLPPYAIYRLDPHWRLVSGVIFAMTQGGLVTALMFAFIRNKCITVIWSITASRTIGTTPRWQLLIILTAYYH